MDGAWLSPKPWLLVCQLLPRTRSFRLMSYQERDKWICIPSEDVSALAERWPTLYHPEVIPQMATEARKSPPKAWR
jgi:hypothetical protein